MSEFKLTYATMFNPPEELHQRFDEALVRVKASLGKEYGMLIHNQDVFTKEKIKDHSSANIDQVLAVMH